MNFTTESSTSDWWNTSRTADIEGPSVSELAQDYAIYHIGVGIHKYFLPVLIPIGFAGNIMSYLVMSLVCKGWGKGRARGSG